MLLQAHEVLDTPAASLLSREFLDTAPAPAFVSGTRSRQRGDAVVPRGCTLSCRSGAGSSIVATTSATTLAAITVADVRGVVPRHSFGLVVGWGMHAGW